jgi:hypothetical protein
MALFGYLQDINGDIAMTSRTTNNQIAFRYRASDSPAGVSRKTAKLLAERLGVDETQVIHRALHDLAVRVLPQYEADDGPLSTGQLRQIRRRAPATKARSVRSTLFPLSAK